MDPKLVWIGLFGLGLAWCYFGFLLGGALFDRKRDLAAIFYGVGSIVGGAGIAAFSVAAWLSY